MAASCGKIFEVGQLIRGIWWNTEQAKIYANIYYRVGSILESNLYQIVIYSLYVKISLIMSNKIGELTKLFDWDGCMLSIKLMYAHHTILAEFIYNKLFYF